MKACAMSEDTSRYWYDAVSIIAHTELDWDYLVSAGAPARRAEAAEPAAVRDLAGHRRATGTDRDAPRRHRDGEAGMSTGRIRVRRGARAGRRWLETHA